MHFYWKCCSRFSTVSILIAANNTPIIYYRQQYKNKQIKQKKVKTSSSKDPTLHHQKPPSTSSNNKEKDRKQPQRDTKPKVIKYEGIHFPDCLDTPSAVAKVLAQKPGVMTAMELKAATQSSATDGDSSYQLKEAKFLQKVKEISEEEKANEIRWYIVTIRTCTSMCF